MGGRKLTGEIASVGDLVRQKGEGPSRNTIGATTREGKTLMKTIDALHVVACPTGPNK